MISLTQDESSMQIELKNQKFLYELPGLDKSTFDLMLNNEDGIIQLIIYELELNYRFKIIEILRSFDFDLHYFIKLDVQELLYSNPSLGNLILNSPILTLNYFERALNLLQMKLLNYSNEEDILNFKPNLHIRLKNLPNLPKFQRTLIPTSENVGQLIALKATVLRTNPVKLRGHYTTYKCLKCQNLFNLSIQSDVTVQSKPLYCLTDAKPLCNGTKFIMVEQDSIYNNNNLNFGNRANHHNGFYRQYQEIKVQEMLGGDHVGTIPKSIIVVLEDDLVDSVKPGNVVLIIGIVRHRWQQSSSQMKYNIEKRTNEFIMTYILANNLIVQEGTLATLNLNRDLINGFYSFWDSNKNCILSDQILRSFCPKIHNLLGVKLACLLTIIGGVTIQNNSNNNNSSNPSSPSNQNYQGLNHSNQSNNHHHYVRGSPHLLLVGDPGTGKSQLLRFAAKLVPRAVLTTGIGTSGVGLTVAAIKDQGEWQLEPGALVMADRGLCCIDEFSSIKEADKTAILEAMEQQTISIAKAGIVTKLNTRCSVLAATNPKGKYDPQESLTTNLAIGGPLLSRFDLILILLDNQDSNWDKDVCNAIINNEMELNIKNENNSNLNQIVEFNFKQLQHYLTFIQSTFQPSLSLGCEQLLTSYYQLKRRSESSSKARTTVRLLESLIRLSQAHAKLRCSNIATIVDAAEVLLLVDNAELNGILNNKFKLDIKSNVLITDDEKKLKLKYSTDEVFIFNNEMWRNRIIDLIKFLKVDESFISEFDTMVDYYYSLVNDHDKDSLVDI